MNPVVIIAGVAWLVGLGAAWTVCRASAIADAELAAELERRNARSRCTRRAVR